MNVGVVGASGYSGETLVKLLLGHPLVTLGAVTSRQQVGKPLAQVIPALRGADRGLRFVDSNAAALAASDIELFFLALPHGAAVAVTFRSHEVGPVAPIVPGRTARLTPHRP